MRSLEGGQGHGGFTQAVQQHPLEASSSCLSRLLSTACCLSCIGCFMSQGGSCKKLHPETEKKTFISFKEWRNLSYKPPNRLSVTSYWPKLYHYILYAKKKKKKISGTTVQLVLKISVVVGQKESRPVLKHVATHTWTEVRRKTEVGAATQQWTTVIINRVSHSCMCL